MKNSYLLTMIFAATICSVGCAGLGKSKLRGPSAFKGILSEEKPEFTTPSSMVAIWKPSTFEKPGTTSIRGFGGRFYFHNAHNEPVKVDGLLTIYGYDDANGDTSGKADRKFVFESSTFQQHYSASGIGDSYSFWVPWDDVGGFEKTITLIPVFKSANGDIPESKPATLRLPGKKRAVVATAQDSLYGPGTQVISASGIVSKKPMVQHAFAETETSANGAATTLEPLARRRPTTLRLPRNLVDRMARTTPMNPSDGIGRRVAAADRMSESTQKKIAERNNLSLANSGTSESETSSLDPQHENSMARKIRPVFGQPGSF